MTDTPLRRYVDTHEGRRRATDELLPHPHDNTEACPGGCEDILVMEDAVCKSRANFVRLGRVEELLAINSAKIDTNSRETSEILSLMREGEAFFKFSKKIGDVLKWMLGIASAVAVFWASVKGWKL